VTDSLGNKTKFRFQSGSARTVIPAKGFLLVWADESRSQGPLHTNFKLSSSGEELALILPDGKTVVDSVIYGSQSSGKSWGRQADGDSLWIVFNTPTPGSSNHEAVPPIDESVPLVVYPNPSYHNDKLFFNKPIAFTMYDYLGRKVMAFEKMMSVSVVGLNPGVYFIRTTEGEVLRWVKL
jgi:hypothetical protein